MALRSPTRAKAKTKGTWPLWTMTLSEEVRLQTVSVTAEHALHSTRYIEWMKVLIMSIDLWNLVLIASFEDTPWLLSLIGPMD